MLGQGVAQSLARIAIHLVFSTKNRERWLHDAFRPELFGYMATVGRNLGCEVFRVGGVADHVHLAIDLGRTRCVADFVKQVKQSSSVWMKERSTSCRGFEWQAGYGAFSVGQSQLPKLVEYIGRQEEHHRRVGFREEYLGLLEKYGLSGDERYLWD
jgi:REP element-mobilizing transposase RayT